MSRSIFVFRLLNKKEGIFIQSCTVVSHYTNSLLNLNKQECNLGDNCMGSFKLGRIFLFFSAFSGFPTWRPLESILDILRVTSTPEKWTRVIILFNNAIYWDNGIKCNQRWKLRILSKTLFNYKYAFTGKTHPCRDPFSLKKKNCSKQHRHHKQALVPSKLCIVTVTFHFQPYATAEEN